MSDSDLHLVQAFRAGDRDAAEHVRGWVERALAPFSGRLGADLHDLEQDVLTEVVDLLHRGVEVASSFRGLVWRIAMRSAIDRLRHRTRWRFEGFDSDPIDPHADPLAETLSDERIRRLAAVVSSMPRACRQLWRWIVDGWSYRDISGHLGVSEGTLRVRALRCRQRAQASLRNDGTLDSPYLQGDPE